MRKYYLYALYDPELNIPKYIGISNNPDRRFLEHLSDISITKKTKWILKLKLGGKIPRLKVLKETNDVHQVISWERLCISKLKDKYNLVNSTEGGEYYGIGVPIKEFDLDGNYLNSYNSIIEYLELNNMDKNCSSAISYVCLRKRNYAYNRIFRRIDDFVTKLDLCRLKHEFHRRDPKQFIIVSPDKEILGHFNSIQEALRLGFGSYECISLALRDVNGFNSVNGNLVCYNIDDFDFKLKKYLLGKSKNHLKDCISKYDLDGNLLDTYYTLTDAYASITNNNKVSGNLNLIKDCCNGTYKLAFGFQWKYGNKSKIDKFSGRIKRKLNTPVGLYSSCGKLIKTWNSCREAANELNLDRAGINRAACGYLKTYKGYIWKYILAV